MAAKTYEVETGASPALETTNFRVYLQNEFVRRCRKNQRYSLSAFARSLGMDVSTLAKVLKGQRAIRGRAIRRIGEKLGLDPITLSRFEAASPRANARRKPAVAAGPDRYQQLTHDAFEVIADWQHYAILELMAVEGFRPEPAWIARKLGIAVGEVRAAVERLQRIGMVSVSPEGVWKDVSGGYTTTLGNAFTGAAFKKLQAQLLEKSRAALENVPLDRRSHTAMTMAIDSRRLPEARRMIREFQRELNRFLSEGAGTRLGEVYNLSMSLFPLSAVEGAP